MACTSHLTLRHTHPMVVARGTTCLARFVLATHPSYIQRTRQSSYDLPTDSQQNASDLLCSCHYNLDKLAPGSTGFPQGALCCVEDPGHELFVLLTHTKWQTGQTQSPSSNAPLPDMACCAGAAISTENISQPMAAQAHTQCICPWLLLAVLPLVVARGAACLAYFVLVTQGISEVQRGRLV